MIYTGSYFTLPKNFKGLKIQISNTKPEWFEVDLVLDKLFPDWNIINEFKQTKNIEKFNKEYLKQLSKYHSKALRSYLESFNKDVVLLCWETKNHCHRYVLANYLGNDIKEIK